MAGDACLIAVAQALAKPSEAGRALVARYDGEEFMVLLVGMLPPEAETAMQAMRSRVEALSLCHGHIGAPVTVSVGLATAEGPLPPIPQLIAAADQAVYLAKAQGRNRVEYRRITSE